MATYYGEDQTAQLFIWLRLHGANPDEIPRDEDMTISTDENGVQWLHWSQFALLDGGRYMNPWGTGAAVEEHKTRLVSPPPDWWEPQIQPTRERLIEQLAAAQQEAENFKGRATAMQNRAERAEAIVAAVGKLHVRNANSGTCEHCSERDYPDYEVMWPCPTMRALGEADPPAACGLTVAGVGATPLGPCIATEPHEIHEAANGAKWRPNLGDMITFPEPVTAEEVERIRKRWAESHGHGSKDDAGHEATP